MPNISLSREALVRRYHAIRSHPAAARAGDWLIAAGVCTFALLMPMGNMFAEIGGVLCLAGILWAYLFNFRQSALHRYPLWPLYALFLAFLAFKVVHSVHLQTSWYVFNSNIHKGFVLFLAGLEFVRTRKRLYLFALLLAAASLVQGLDGIYQFMTGTDFIKGAITEGGRLTASMGGGRVGNYMSMTLLPSLVLWVLLPASLPRAARLGITAAFLAPGMFLWMFAQARSGWVGLLIAVLLLALMLNTIRLRHLLPLGAVILLLGFFGPERVRFATALNDVRISDIWPAAMSVFHEHFWLGVGNGAFRHGTNLLGIVMEWNGTVVAYPHPHNIYVQLLAETGIIGFGLFAAFTLGTGVWSGLRIRQGLRTADRPYWFVTALLWASYFGGYLGAAVSAHSFFRTWWLGTAMLILGAMVGACASARPHPAQAAATPSAEPHGPAEQAPAPPVR